MIKVAEMIKNMRNHYTGFLVMVDNIPPYPLFFPFAPEVWEDDWSAEYDSVSSPGSRYTYPVFKGCTLRRVTFTLRFDSHYPIDTPEAAEKYRGKVGDKNSFWAYTKQHHNVAPARAILEKCKLPKQGVANVAQGVLGGFTKVRPGPSDPSPPLCFIAPSPFKFFVGYFSDIKFKEEQYNKYMLCTRFSAQCSFIVTPDYVFTTLEDVLREVTALSGLIV